MPKEFDRPRSRDRERSHRHDEERDHRSSHRHRSRSRSREHRPHRRREDDDRHRSRPHRSRSRSRDRHRHRRSRSRGRSSPPPSAPPSDKPDLVAVMRLVRELSASLPELRAPLRTLLAALDLGETVATEGLTVAARVGVSALFVALRLHSSAAGWRVPPALSRLSLLDTLGPLLRDESSGPTSAGAGAGAGAPSPHGAVPREGGGGARVLGPARPPHDDDDGEEEVGPFLPHDPRAGEGAVARTQPPQRRLVGGALPKSFGPGATAGGGGGGAGSASDALLASLPATDAPGVRSAWMLVAPDALGMGGRGVRGAPRGATSGDAEGAKAHGFAAHGGGGLSGGGAGAAPRFASAPGPAAAQAAMRAAFAATSAAQRGEKTLVEIHAEALAAADAAAAAARVKQGGAAKAAPAPWSYERDMAVDLVAKKGSRDVWQPEVRGVDPQAAAAAAAGSLGARFARGAYETTFL